jgi:hypothetical protein
LVEGTSNEYKMIGKNGLFTSRLRKSMCIYNPNVPLQATSAVYAVCTTTVIQREPLRYLVVLCRKIESWSIPHERVEPRHACAAWMLRILYDSIPSGKHMAMENEQLFTYTSRYINIKQIKTTSLPH